MSDSTPSTRRTKRRARSQEADIEIQRNGKIVAIIRKRPGEVEVELAPEIRAIPGLPARFRYCLMEAVEKFIDAEPHEECSAYESRGLTKNGKPDQGDASNSRERD
jgi:hypothetical protein